MVVDFNSVGLVSELNLAFTAHKALVALYKQYISVDFKLIIGCNFVDFST